MHLGAQNPLKMKPNTEGLIDGQDQSDGDKAGDGGRKFLDGERVHV